MSCATIHDVMRLDYGTFSLFLIAAGSFLVFPVWQTSASDAELSALLNDAQAKVAREIIASQHCPCGCGRYLPGSPNAPACFGCSVGKREITRIAEALASGSTRFDIVLELNGPVLIDVFGDYTDKGVRVAWERAKRVAAELEQYRVVLRTPGLSAAARRAVKVAECVREQGMFNQFQEILIHHPGPWNLDTLIDLAKKIGLDAVKIRDCVERQDVRPQVDKDLQHARLRGVSSFPAVSVNLEMVPNTDTAIRKAIKRVLQDDSI